MNRRTALRTLALVRGVDRPTAALARGTLLGTGVRDALAGAAGTTALNATTHLDMALRARGGSSTPEKTVETLTDRPGVELPGDDEAEQRRVSGPGPLLGVLTGVGTGILVAALHERWRPGFLADAALAAATAVIGANVPMTVLGVSDPRTRSAAEWAADLVPHAVHGLATSGTLRLMR